MEQVVSAKPRRIHFLDELRGFAVVCMVIHHCFYDMGVVLGLPIGVRLFDFFCYVQPFFWLLFIGISGISSQLSRNNLLRGGKLLGVAAVITAVTVFLMPMMGFEDEGIYFGILHFLAVCMLVYWALQKLLGKVPTWVGLIVCAALFFFTYSIGNGHLGFEGFGIPLPESWYQYSFLAPIGLPPDSFYSADYFPLLPWIFIFFIGTFLGRYAKAEKFPEWTYKKRVSFFSAVGRWALVIYVLHQPVLYGVFLLIGKLIS